MNDVAEDVTDPETGVSVSDRLRAGIRVGSDAGDGEDCKNVSSRPLRATATCRSMPWVQVRIFRPISSI